ncbi:MAG: septation protein SepH [Nocardioidaceae bacterium]
MAHLTLVGLSEDKTRLLLVDDQGTEHTLAVDASLRAALRGDPSRLGQLEIDMESSLRPRDIQARIRAGESAEVVARAAQTTVEKIMPFAAPVLAERAHIAERAQRASVRRRSGEAGGRTLSQSVDAHLGGLNVSADSVEWDAWKRADGRWTLSASYSSPQRSGTAAFAFDAPGNYVVAEDDDARWLIGELPEEPVAPPADDLSAARRRRLAAVSDEEPLPLGDDALDMVSDVDPDASTADLSETAEHVRRAQAPGEPAESDTLGAEPPAEAFLDSVFAAQNPDPDELAGLDFDDEGAQVDPASAVEPDVDDDEPAAHEPPHRRAVKKTRGRASVPSWDEIMFGGGKQD